MPLLIITGRPASGKSTIAQRVLNYFKERRPNENIELVSDEADINFSRSIHGDFKKEKIIRGALRSNVQRLLDKNTIVICDSLNHIKGYRYELFCLAKNMETRYAVLYCDTPTDVCRWLNVQRPEAMRYPDDVLLGLFKRYEKPDSKNRWDLPIFSVSIGYEEKQTKTRKISVDEHDEFQLEDDEEMSPELTNISAEQPFTNDAEKMPQKVSIPLEGIYATLIEGKELTVNKCMKAPMQQNSDISVNELDRTIQAIIGKLLTAQRSAMPGDKLMILDGERGQANKVNFTKTRTLLQLNRSRQQFITYLRSHPVENLDIAGVLFVDFLNSNP